MWRIAIIGGSGFLGRAFCKAFSQEYDLVIPGRSVLDIRSLDDWVNLFMNNEVDFILFLAGSKDVRLLEKDWEIACEINVFSVINCLRAIKKASVNPKLIYFSSDYVFDGMRGCYTSDDQPCPQTNYGRSKFLAEMILQKSCLDYKIARSSAIIGDGGLFYDWLIRSLKTEKYIDMYSDVFFTPTDVNFLIEEIKKLIDNYSSNEKKIFHIVGDQSLSRYDFACSIKEKTQGAVAEIRERQLGVSNVMFKNLTMIGDCIMGGELLACKDYRIRRGEIMF